MASDKDKESGNVVSRGVEFTQDSMDELKKVHFPTREETIRWTIAVFVMLVFFAVFLGTADWIVGGMMKSILT